MSAAASPVSDAELRRRVVTERRIEVPHEKAEGHFGARTSALVYLLNRLRGDILLAENRLGIVVSEVQGYRRCTSMSRRCHVWVKGVVLR